MVGWLVGWTVGWLDSQSVGVLADHALLYFSFCGLWPQNPSHVTDVVLHKYLHICIISETKI